MYNSMVHNCVARILLVLATTLLSVVSRAEDRKLLDPNDDSKTPGLAEILPQQDFLSSYDAVLSFLANAQLNIDGVSAGSLQLPASLQMDTHLPFSPGIYQRMQSIVEGPRDSGGGDPQEIEAAAYPDKEALHQAIYMAVLKVWHSQYSKTFKKSFALEAKRLQIEEKYLYLPQLIILSSGDGIEGYGMPTEGRAFVSLGAMTRIAVDAPIYFSERATHLSIDALAKLIVHEIIHHVISMDASHDEEYVADLTDSIINNSYSNYLAFTLETGIVVRKGFVSKTGLVRYILKKAAMLDWYLQLSDAAAEQFAVSQDLSFKASDNIASMDLFAASSIVSEAIYDRDKERPDFRRGFLTSTHENYSQIWKEMGPTTIEELAKEIFPENPLFQLKRFPGCKRQLPFFSEIRICDKFRLTIGELFASE